MDTNLLESLSREKFMASTPLMGPSPPLMSLIVGIQIEKID
jgi:hypothetical protein